MTDEARKYGCRSAMASFVAKKLCPHLNLVPCDFSHYSACSKLMMQVLSEFGPMSPASLDEAYISLTTYCRDKSVSPAEAAATMRAKVLEKTGLSVSAGVSSNALISKIAADFNKPNGQYVVEPTAADAIRFMGQLPIRKVPGIGRVTERWLNGIGVEKVEDIYRLRGKLYLVVPFSNHVLTRCIQADLIQMTARGKKLD